MFLDNISPWNEYNVARRPTVPPFSRSNNQNNSTSSPGFLGQRFNITNYWRHGFNMTVQQLVMVNYACAFSQSESAKYFERIIVEFNDSDDSAVGVLYSRKKFFNISNLLNVTLSLRNPSGSLHQWWRFLLFAASFWSSEAEKLFHELKLHSYSATGNEPWPGLPPSPNYGTILQPHLRGCE